METAEAAQPEEPVFAVPDSGELDMDSLHILPLDLMPLVTPSLKRARLVKNIRLESKVELFNDKSAGSGQVDAEDLPEIFNWPEGAPHPDDVMIKRLCGLRSFDVYTLRIKLRELNINVESHDHLKLSKTKNAELTDYMKTFTQPLIETVYGDVVVDAKCFADLISMFATSKRKDARDNLKKLARKLQVPLTEVPKYLEEYGDTYLSLAYFRNHLDALVPQIIEFEEAMGELMENDQLRRDRRLCHSVEYISDRVSIVTQSVLNRFKKFDLLSEEMWENLSPTTFSATKEAIRQQHVAIGAVMCGLTVKMDGWQEKFGSGGSLMRRANFVMSDMMQGMELISEIEEVTSSTETQKAPSWAQ